MGDEFPEPEAILAKIRGEVMSEIVLKTIMWELAKLYSMPRILVPRGMEDEVASGMQARGIITYDPDNPLGPGQIEWLKSQDITPAVADFLSRVENSIARPGQFNVAAVVPEPARTFD